jgi:hypothetical protein
MPIKQNQRVAIALFACLVLWCGWRSKMSSQPTTSGDISQSDSETVKNHAARRQNWEWGNPDPGVTFFTFMLFIVGAVQAGLFLVQLQLIRKSLDDAKIAAEAAKEAADVAKIQADTARATLLTMQDTAQRQLRAYIRLNTNNTPNLTGEFHVHSVIENSGQTPAYDVQSWTFVEAFANPLPEGHQFAAAPEVIPNTRFVVNPDSIHSTWSPRSNAVPLTAEEIAAIEDEYLTLYYWGEVRYRDAFNANHWSRFRLSWTNRPVYGGWRYCDDGNDAN